MKADDFFTLPPKEEKYDAEQRAEDYEDHCNDCYDRLQDYLISQK